MDLDNFDFRPITEGLGFDKTTKEKKREVFQAPSTPVVDKLEVEIPNPAPVSRSLKKMLDSLPPSMDFKEDKHREKSFKAPAPQPIKTPSLPLVEEVRTPQVSENFDVTLDDSLSKAFPKIEIEKHFYHQTVTPQPQYKEVTSSFASAILDGFIVLGLSSLFVVSLVAITRVDLLSMISNEQMGFKVGMELSLLYFGTTVLYFMLARGLWGATLGDWAFDIQLGTDEERTHLMYPFQVIFRTIVIILTGIITIPILSMAFGKDLAYYFSGLKLYFRQY